MPLSQQVNNRGVDLSKRFDSDFPAAKRGNTVQIPFNLQVVLNVLGGDSDGLRNSAINSNEDATFLIRLLFLPSK